MRSAAVVTGEPWRYRIDAAPDALVRRDGRFAAGVADVVTLDAVGWCWQIQRGLQFRQRLFLPVRIRLPLGAQGLQGLGRVFGCHLYQFTRLASTETPRVLSGKLDKLSAEATRQEIAIALQSTQRYGAQDWLAKPYHIDAKYSSMRGPWCGGSCCVRRCS